MKLKIEVALYHQKIYTNFLLHCQALFYFYVTFLLLSQLYGVNIKNIYSLLQQ